MNRDEILAIIHGGIDGLERPVVILGRVEGGVLQNHIATMFGFAMQKDHFIYLNAEVYIVNATKLIRICELRADGA